jgi:hypothetical protein
MHQYLQRYRSHVYQYLYGYIFLCIGYLSLLIPAYLNTAFLRTRTLPLPLIIEWSIVVLYIGMGYKMEMWPSLRHKPVFWFGLSMVSSITLHVSHFYHFLRESPGLLHRYCIPFVSQVECSMICVMCHGYHHCPSI